MKQEIKNILSDEDFSTLFEYFIHHDDDPDIRKDFRENPEYITRCLLAMQAQQDIQLKEMSASIDKIEDRYLGMIMKLEKSVATSLDTITHLQKCRASLEAIVLKQRLQLQMREMEMTDDYDQFILH